MADSKPNLPAKDAAPAKEPGEMVVYQPGEGDPIKTRWRGVEFKANVPVRIFDLEHIDAARINKHFSVGGKNESGEASGPPTTAMEYRGHVIDWLRDVDTVDKLVIKWAADRQLRQECEVGQDDISYLGTIVEPKLHTLRTAEGLSENAVAGLFVNRGVLEIPWRS